MIQFVLISLLCSAVVITGTPADVAADGNLLTPPNAAAEARRLVHQSNWAAVGTISTYKTNVGRSMVSVLSTSDSKIGGPSTGDIYFVLLLADLPTTDITFNDRVTFMFSDAQDGGCKQRNVDPMGRACARTMIMGEVNRLTNGTEEYARGWEAFSDRHEWVKKMHNGIFLCKLNISNVVVFSGDAGYRDVSPKEYYKAHSD